MHDSFRLYMQMLGIREQNIFCVNNDTQIKNTRGCTMLWLKLAHFTLTPGQDIGLVLFYKENPLSVINWSASNITIMGSILLFFQRVKELLMLEEEVCE